MSPQVAQNLQLTPATGSALNQNAREARAAYIMEEEDKMVKDGAYVNHTRSFIKEVYILDWKMKRGTASKILNNDRAKATHKRQTAGSHHQRPGDYPRYQMQANKNGDLEIVDATDHHARV